MKLRLRDVLAILIVFVMVGWCTSVGSAQDHAKPRERESKERSDKPRAEKREKQRQPPPSTARERQPRPRHEGQEARPRDNARDRHPRPRVDNRREPGRRYEGKRDYDRYHWNKYRNHNRYSRDRFPRLYFGLRLFDHRYYRGYPFGPHYRMLYRDRYRVHRLFYWPFYYPPEFGCDQYWVPRDRILVVDDNGDEYYEYFDYDYVYICFD